MRVALTGATGFLGRYIAHALIAQGYTVTAWYRDISTTFQYSNSNLIHWIAGELQDQAATETLLAHNDALVHAALWRPHAGFRGAEGDIVRFADININGSLKLFDLAFRRELSRCIFISTCAVHEIILPNRELDESHPSTPLSHYGAYKAALEQFVHSYGHGFGFPICSLRPTGIYGIAHPIEQSKWFNLIQSVAHGKTVHCQQGGKEVHARDVAQAVVVLLQADESLIKGQAFNCYDNYVSEFEVAELVKELTGSSSVIQGSPKKPMHHINVEKLKELGVTFGGKNLLKDTIQSLLCT